MTKEELAKKKGAKAPKPQTMSASEALIVKSEPETPAEPKQEKPKTPKKPAESKPAEKKRGRKPGTVLVKDEAKRKTVSISVAPEDEEIYKKVLAENPKRFKGMSQLVEQALDYFIKENHLN